MTSELRLGWFADIDPAHPFGWQPCFQTVGACFSFEVWFETEEDCLRFITETILPNNQILR